MFCSMFKQGAINLSFVLKAVTISLFDPTWNNFKEYPSLRMSATWYEADVSHFCGL